MSEPAPEPDWSPLFASEEERGLEESVARSYRPPKVWAAAETIPLPEGTRGEAEDPSSAPTVDLGESAAPIDESSDEELRTTAERLRPIALIGEGGMGRVLRARQASLNREVAVKVSKRSGGEATRRFLSEAQVAGRLEHANIVPVHSLGEGPDGRPQLVMKCVRGASWRELIAEGEADQREHLRILDAVCHAMAYAHTEGILHRDLKPANIMVGPFGQVYVMDWGLAVSLREDEPLIASASRVRDPAGTPCYMAPELALGLGEAQDARTDVYLLGACLHEAIVGRPPHLGSTMREVLEKAVSSEPLDYEADVPAELVALIHRAMARDPEDRFQSVEELRGALQAFLEHDQARALLDQGEALLAQLADLVAAEESPDRAREVHDRYAQARFAFRHAGELWPEADGLGERLSRLRGVAFEYARQCEDLAFAERLALEEDSEDFREAVRELKEALERRARELAGFRERAIALDWSAVSRPLGGVFLVAAPLGAAGSLITGRLRRAGGAAAYFGWRMAMWALIVALIGGAALALMRRAGVRRGQLLSSRLFALWASVAAACFVHGTLIGTLDQEIHAAPSGIGVMFGIGFAATALQTQRWVWALAVLSFAAAVPIHVFKDQAFEILAALWFFLCSITGLALRSGLAPQGGSEDQLP